MPRASTARRAQAANAATPGIALATSTETALGRWVRELHERADAERATRGEDALLRSEEWRAAALRKLARQARKVAPRYRRGWLAMRAAVLNLRFDERLDNLGAMYFGPESDRPEFVRLTSGKAPAQIFVGAEADPAVAHGLRAGIYDGRRHRVIASVSVGADALLQERVIELFEQHAAHLRARATVKRAPRR